VVAEWTGGEVGLIPQPEYTFSLFHPVTMVSTSVRSLRCLVSNCQWLHCRQNMQCL